MERHDKAHADACAAGAGPTPVRTMEESIFLTLERVVCGRGRSKGASKIRAEMHGTRGQAPRPIRTRLLFPVAAFGTMSCCTQHFAPAGVTCRYNPFEPRPSKSWRPCFASSAVAVRTRTSVSRKRVVLAMTRAPFRSFFRLFETDDNGWNRTTQVSCGNPYVLQPIEWMIKVDNAGLLWTETGVRGIRFPGFGSTVKIDTARDVERDRRERSDEQGSSRASPGGEYVYAR